MHSGVREALLAPTVAPALPDEVRSLFPPSRPAKKKSSAPHGAELNPPRRQQSMPHSGVREALLAPTAAPALPDAVRSIFPRHVPQKEELRPTWSRAPSPTAAAERAALRSARSSARAHGSSGSAGWGAEHLLASRPAKRKNSAPHGAELHPPRRQQSMPHSSFHLVTR